MKADLIEHEGCFEISLTPENMEEQASIVRMGMNAKKEVRSFSASVYKDLHVSGYVVLGKRKDANSYIRHR